MNTILLTGEPGVGKTYILNKVIEELEKASLPLSGFTTQEIKDNEGRRIGFEMVSVTNPTDKKLLSHINPIKNNVIKVFGKWNVSVNTINYFSVKYIREPKNWCIFILDEIGPMQCQSDQFITKVRKLIQLSIEGKCAIIGTIKLNKCNIPHIDNFIEEIKSIVGDNILNVTPDKRNIITEDIIKLFI